MAANTVAITGDACGPPLGAAPAGEGSSMPALGVAPPGDAKVPGTSYHATGQVPCVMGYDVDNRRLLTNKREAKIVRHIFRRFVELGSSTRLVKELRLDGVASKAWTTQEVRVHEGKPIDKSLIYKILSNRVYMGEIRHRDQWYPGEHAPIVERPLWDAAPAGARPRPSMAGHARVQ